MVQKGFFDIAKRYAGLDAKNAPLLKIDEVVPWEDLRDRLSFMRFLGLGLEDKVPDAKTVWLYREQLARAGFTGDQIARVSGLRRSKEGKGRIASSGPYTYGNGLFK